MRPEVDGLALNSGSALSVCVTLAKLPSPLPQVPRLLRDGAAG